MADPEIAAKISLPSEADAGRLTGRKYNFFSIDFKNFYQFLSVSRSVLEI